MAAPSPRRTRRRLLTLMRVTQATFGEAPPRLASFGYDAGALAATLARRRASSTLR